MFRRALAIAEATLEPDNPSRAIVLNNLAIVLESKGQFVEASKLFEKALQAFESSLGPEHAYTRDAARDLENSRQCAVALDSASSS